MWPRSGGAVKLVLCLLVLAAGHPARAFNLERVSVDSAGAQGNSDSDTASISADGRYVAFNSGASNLVAGDTNGSLDVFVHDRVTGTTERVSVDSTGAQGNSSSGSPSISADGRYVAFTSNASNLVAGDTNGFADAFVHDRVTGATERVSVDSIGAQGNSGGYAASISADGHYVALVSDASNLVAGDTNGFADAFVHDRMTGATERVSVDSTGAQSNGRTYTASISADGRYVAFGSGASNLVTGDTHGYVAVFVHDRMTGATELGSVDSTGAAGSGTAYAASISADGRYVAFASDARLVAGDTNANGDVFVHDRMTGATELVSVDGTGVQGNGVSYAASISADGRYVAFGSEASNLVAGDTNSSEEVFVHDRMTGATTSVSVNSTGA
ncbi:MAG: PD40 domain-containing protein [Deltaproteobacteria bacterium]|nr:PD40 domain-containing protein [Deltaproteobacteria bacterium]MBI3386882.1 PD40 domain-containing protein [Deltaproteobacteria bacterium]